MIEEHNTALWMKKVSRDCRIAWRAMGKWASIGRLEGPSWPEWCLLPDEAWIELNESYLLPNAGVARGQRFLQLLRDSLLLSMLGLWRLSKGIYRFNEHLKSELMASELTGDIPADVLKRLPEWCIYLELDGVFESGVFSDVRGAWVRLGYGLHSKVASVVVVLTGESNRRYVCLLSEKTIPEMVEACIDRQYRSLSKPLDCPPDSEEHIGAVKCLKLLGSKEAQVEMLSKVINALLYICSEEPDIEDREEPEAKPTLARTKLVGKRDMFVAADRVRVWNVGEKIGEVIRQHREGPTDRKHTRRHLRRAHWHGYWLGPRGGDERRFTYKWLSPMVVGVSP